MPLFSRLTLCLLHFQYQLPISHHYVLKAPHFPQLYIHLLHHQAVQPQTLQDPLSLHPSCPASTAQDISISASAIVSSQPITAHIYRKTAAMCKQYYDKHTECRHTTKRPDGFVSCGPRCFTNKIEAVFRSKRGMCGPCLLSYWAKEEERRRFRLANSHIEF